MTDYEDVILPSSGKKVRVPVDKDGYVPPQALAAILESRGSPYNDYQKKADVVLPIRLTPRQAAPWIDDPDRYDIESVDVRGKPMHNTGSRTGEHKKVHDKITVYAMPGEEEKVRQTFDDAFTLEEQKKMVAKNGLILEARPLQDGVLGTHCRNEIDLERYGGVRNPVMVHEGVHHLRAVDDDRTKVVTKRISPESIKYTGRSKNPNIIQDYKVREMSCVEESCTVAEQMARQKEFMASGYYASVQVYDPKTKRYRNPTSAEAERMAREDYDLFTNGTGKPLSGKAAIESVNKHWAESNIARLKLGNRMAISTVSEVTGSNVDFKGQSKSRTSTSKSKSSTKKAPAKKAAKAPTKRTSAKPAARSAAKPAAKKAPTQTTLFMKIRGKGRKK